MTSLLRRYLLDEDCHRTIALVLICFDTLENMQVVPGLSGDLCGILKVIFVRQRHKPTT